MSTELAVVFTTFNAIPDPVKSKDPLTSVVSVLNTMEAYLSTLQSLRTSLIHINVMHKKNVVNTIACVKKIYFLLETWEEVKGTCGFIQTNLDTGSEFCGANIAKDLLLNKNTIVLNRNIFSAKRHLETLRKAGKIPTGVS